MYAKFADWQALLRHVCLRDEPMYYQGPLDHAPVRIDITRVFPNGTVRVKPPSPGCDPFTADVGHLDRFRYVKQTCGGEGWVRVNVDDREPCGGCEECQDPDPIVPLPREQAVIDRKRRIGCANPEQCSVSSFIDDSLTFGWGDLSDLGEWEFPCRPCEEDHYLRREYYGADWFQHLHLSPYCHLNYPGIFDSHGREACPCGWVGGRHDR